MFTRFKVPQLRERFLFEEVTGSGHEYITFIHIMKIIC